MLNRCLDKNNKQFKEYGGRGIDIAEEFMCFENYVKYIETLDNYNNISNLDVDRIDNSKGYIKGNLRLINRSENCKNTRRNKLIEVEFPNGYKYVDISVNLCNKFKFHPSHIKKCCIGERKTHKQCKFRYVEGEN